MKWYSMDEKPRPNVLIVLFFMQKRGFVYTAQLLSNGQLWIADEITAIESWEKADKSLRWGYLEVLRDDVKKSLTNPIE